MKEVRRIKFTGMNLNDVFALPCVEKIVKRIDKPQLVLNRNMIYGSIYNVALVDDELVEYDSGKWRIDFKLSATWKNCHST